jgi:type III pantothenate kinase
MQALVDIGNTRLKWALFDDERLGRPGSAIHRGSPDTAFVEFAAALPQAVTRVVVANVAGERLGERFRTVVSASTNAVVEFVTTTEHRFGVRCAYADPSRLGVDRWVRSIFLPTALRATQRS